MSDDPTDRPPRRYVLGGVFARGGVGAIHSAHDRGLHRELAYKVLLPERAEGAAFRARFVREARLTAQLQHPNIVPVHDLGVDADGSLFYAMKRVHGRSLGWILRALAEGDETIAAHFSLPRLLTLFGQMCQAVHYAHTRGVLHRDLKPGNIMIGGLGEVLVMDWGLAKRIPPLPTVGADPFGCFPTTPSGSPEPLALAALAEDDTGRIEALFDEDLPLMAELAPTLSAPLSGSTENLSQRLDQLDSDWLGTTDPPGADLLGAEGETAGVYETQDGRVLGTPAYMAPEQARGWDLDVRADVYALGAILYEILALRPAFTGGNALTVMTAVVRGEFDPPSAHAAPARPVEVALERICLEAMARKPPDRFDTAWDLFLAIEGFLQGTEEKRRRRAAAEASLREAEAHRLLWYQSRAALRNARRKAARLLANLRATDGLDTRRLVWAAEDERDRYELQAERQRTAMEQCLRGALRAMPGFGPARTALAEHAWDMLQDAELQGDRLARVGHEAELRALDDGTWAPLLRAPALLEVEASPHDCQLTLAPMVESDRRLVPGPVEAMVSPQRRELAPGRYLLRAQAPGYAPVQLPFRATRGQRIAIELTLRPAHELPAGFVHIPAGRTWIGGDREAQRGLAGLHVRLPDFGFQTHPVTMADYLVFLRDVEASEPGAGWARAPRNEPDGGQLLVRDEHGLLTLPGVDDAGHVWDPQLPVMAVSFDDAVAYAEWRTRRDGVRFRLPTEAEWEYAARSPDGRYFPWGDRFVPGFALVLGALGTAQPKPIGFVEEDVNGFGIHDLAGGSRDWCDGWKTANGEMRVQRGGAWWDRPDRARLASRSGWPAASVYGDSGFRLVVSLPPESEGPATLNDPLDPRYGGIREEHLPPI